VRSAVLDVVGGPSPRPEPHRWPIGRGLVQRRGSDQHPRWNRRGGHGIVGAMTRLQRISTALDVLAAAMALFLILSIVEDIHGRLGWAALDFVAFLATIGVFALGLKRHREARIDESPFANRIRFVGRL
jgi:hypothetical protein